MLFSRKKIAVCFVVSIIALLVVGLVFKTTVKAPANTIVYVDDMKKVYYAPPCLKENVKSISGMRLTLLREAEAKNYNPSEECNNKGYFSQEGRSLIGVLFERLGLLKRTSTRWDSDGSWIF